MPVGGAPEPTDDIAALAAVWGREASATAPAVPRPDPGGGPARGSEPPGSGDRRRRGGVLLVGCAAAVLVLVAAVLLLGRDEPSEAEADATTPATTAAPATKDGPAEPAWTAEVTCLPLIDGGATGISAMCPVAVDDERAYVLVDAAGGPAIRALDVASGEVVWEQAVPALARDVRRIPSAVVVLAAGAESPFDNEVVALDPVTGAVRWQRPGSFTGALGPDHVLIDHEVRGYSEEVISTMAVVDVITGRAVVERTGPSSEMYLHPCGEAGLVVASEGERLTALDVVDGAERWSTTAPHLDAFHPLRCGVGTIAFVDTGTLRLLDAGTGAEVGTTVVSPDPDGTTAEVLAVSGETIVVGSSDGARGFRAETGLERLWWVVCRLCGDDLVVGPAGDGVVVLTAIEARTQAPVVDGSGPTLDLQGRAQRVLAGTTLLAWGARGVVVADTADLARPLHLDVGGIRQAAAGSTHLVASTVDAVQAYPL